MLQYSPQNGRDRLVFRKNFPFGRSVFTWYPRRWQLSPLQLKHRPELKRSWSDDFGLSSHSQLFFKWNELHGRKNSFAANMITNDSYKTNVCPDAQQWFPWIPSTEKGHSSRIVPHRIFTGISGKGTLIVADRFDVDIMSSTVTAGKHRGSTWNIRQWDTFFERIIVLYLVGHIYRLDWHMDRQLDQMRCL